MKSRFEPDHEGAHTSQESRLVDPEAYDASEQRFAASLEQNSARFEVEEATPVPSVADQPSAAYHAPAQEEHTAPSQPDLLSTPPADSWRDEVAAKLSSYRSRRRTKAPRYPSLRLKFEEPTWSASPRSEGSLAPAPESSAVESPGPVPAVEPRPVAPAETGRLLEFPRPLYAPPQPLDQLADPVFERPRILEAPELVPPPPALGGIHIEVEEPPAEERRPGIDLPLQPAPMSRRWTALAVDAILVLLAFAAFVAVFLKMTSAQLAGMQALEASAGILGLFWIGYQYSMLVLTGSTPGLRLAKLELNRFDGSPVPRRLRGCRVAALLLSGFSFGLGYAWAFLDEDRLCWHDRITRTYMAPKSSPSESTAD